MKTENKIKLIVAIGLFMSIALVTFDLSAQSKQVRDHTKLQKANSFEVRMKNSDAFTMKSYREDLRSAKIINKENRKKANQNAKKDRIRQNIAQLKSKD